jgi:transcriptional regulator with XRE-family HTH domain
MPRNQALRQARTLRGWSQGILAQKVETSTKNISRWERGETMPSPYYRERLCQLFGLDAKSLGLMPPAGDELPTLANPNSRSNEPLIDPAVPPLLFNAELFVGRDALLQNLLQQALPGNIITLEGLPGVGKTTLLQVLVRHPQIQEHFYDGVLWIGLGPTPDIPRHMVRLVRLLGLPASVLEREHSVDDWSQLLRDELARRRLLVVIDDVWEAKAALPFLVGGPSVTYMITTRLPKVAFSLAQGEPCVVPPLSSEASFHLLTTLVTPLKHVDNPLLGMVVQLTGGLPLALMLMGRYLSSHSYGGQIRRLEAALNRVADLGYRLNLHSTIPPVNYLHEHDAANEFSISAVISLSDRQLPSVAQNALYAISVLPTSPACFSEEAALAVSAVDAEMLDLLVDAGLIEPAENHCYQIHRTIADYARHRLNDKAPLVRLVEYMQKVVVDHATNIALLEREYATLLAGLDTAVALQMRSGVIHGVLALVPFMRMHGFYTQGDGYLRKALQAAIFQQNWSICQKIFGELAAFAQLRQDDTQFVVYQRIWQALNEQQASQNFVYNILPQMNKVGKEPTNTPRLYTI